MEQMYIFIVITVLSPFNTSLSEKLDHRLTGHEPDKGWTRLINEFIRMIFIALIALILEGIVLLGYWVFSLGPLGGAHDSIIYFLIKAFFLGFAFFDFSLERYEKNVFQSLGFAFQNH